MTKLDWEGANKHSQIKRHNIMRVMSASSKLTFGKHRGKTLTWVYSNDYSYYRWLIDNEVIDLKGGNLPEKSAKERVRMYNRYSTISLGRKHVNHIYNHERNKIVCGVDRWIYQPVVIQQAMLPKEDIIKKHTEQAERRGGPNPFKFVCQRCLRRLDTNFDKNK